jgi:hypothetical protein
MRLTASRTSSTASLTSRSSWNSITVVESPSVTVERMWSMPVAVATESSILRVTSVSSCEGGTPG